MLCVEKKVAGHPLLPPLSPPLCIATLVVVVDSPASLHLCVYPLCCPHVRVMILVVELCCACARAHYGLGLSSKLCSPSPVTIAMQTPEQRP